MDDLHKFSFKLHRGQYDYTVNILIIHKKAIVEFFKNRLKFKKKKLNIV